MKHLSWWLLDEYHVFKVIRVIIITLIICGLWVVLFVELIGIVVLKFCCLGSPGDSTRWIVVNPDQLNIYTPWELSCRLGVE